MFGDMMGKLQELKQKMEETKKRLENITVKADSGEGAVVVTANGAKKIVNISIAEEKTIGNKEELEDLLLVAVNRALEKAENVHESEMQGATKDFLPGMPGLD
jgi:nucleoid-associated protein EbfC